MKTLLKFNLVLLCALVFFACEKSDPEFNPPDNLENKLYLEADLTLHRTSGMDVKPSDMIKSQKSSYRGQGDSEELLQVDWSGTHMEYYAHGAISFDIEEGHFKLICSTGEEISGVYHGYGVVIDGQTTVFKTLTVLAGTGRFEQASGNLYVEMRSQKMSKRFPSQTYALKTLLYGSVDLGTTSS